MTRQSFIAFGVTFDDQCEHCGGSNQMAHYWKSSPAPPNHRHPFFLQSLQDHHHRCSSSWTSRIFLSLALSIFGLILPSSTFPTFPGVWINFEIFSFVFRPFPPFQFFHVSLQLFVSTLQFFSQAIFSQLLCLSCLYAPFQYHSNVSFNCEVNKYFFVDTSLISPLSWGEIISL